MNRPFVELPAYLKQNLSDKEYKVARVHFRGLSDYDLRRSHKLTPEAHRTILERIHSVIKEWLSTWQREMPIVLNLPDQ